MNIVERFLSYVAFDTQSSEETNVTPSTEKQRVFAQHLKEELIAEGLQEVELDELGYLYATLPANIDQQMSNTDQQVPTIGFIAHIDTSPDASGKDVKPRIIEKYDGTDILLSESIVTSVEKFPELRDHIGEDLIVTDGTTLLGADDKAGIAEIVQAMVYLQEHPEIKHGKIRVAFNPDEEIGLGAHHFDVKKFGCDFAYTMDGSEVGEIEFENFSAASAKITINGCSVHPGYAKDKMINAVRIATELVNLLPADETPEMTEGYEGFFHLTNLNGSVEKAQLSFIIRDHDREYFESRKAEMLDIVETINEKYGEGVAELEMKDQYYNMREMVEPKMYIIDIAKQAIAEAGMPPKIKAIRGGTDGAQLSFKGLPCPNIFAGGLNFHGPHEFLPIQSMEKAMMTVVNICRITAEQTV
jgi:tripeptide aminopeptidase